MPAIGLSIASFYILALQIKNDLNFFSVSACAALALLSGRSLVLELTSGPRLGISKNQLAKIQKELAAARNTLLSLKDHAGKPVIKVSPSEIGLHIWLIPRAYRGGRFTRLVLQLMPRIIRPNMAHLAMEPENSKVTLSGIPWVLGRGPIGQCWKNRNAVVIDYRKYSKFTPQDWRRLSKEERMGMHYKDVKRMVALYGKVLVVPLVESHGDQVMVGCIVLDAPPGKKKSAEFDARRAAEILTIVGKERISRLIN